ncbi:hypothetical protein Tco_1386917 [Tanacetum coccineum]
MFHLSGFPQESYSTLAQSKVESEPTHGSNVDIHHIQHANKTLVLSAELGNSRMPQQEQTSSNWFQKFVPLIKQESTSRQELGITILPSHSNAEDKG